MATEASLAAERHLLRVRQAEALSALTQRAGVEMPKVYDRGRPKPTPEYMVGDLAVSVLLAEQLAALAAEVDDLRAQVAAKKGTK